MFRHLQHVDRWNVAAIMAAVLSSSTQTAGPGSPAYSTTPYTDLHTTFKDAIDMIVGTTQLLKEHLPRVVELSGVDLKQYLISPCAEGAATAQCRATNLPPTPEISRLMVEQRRQLTEDMRKSAKRVVLVTVNVRSYGVSVSLDASRFFNAHKYKDTGVNSYLYR